MGLSMNAEGPKNTQLKSVTAGVVWEAAKDIRTLSGVSQIISRHLPVREADVRSLTSPGPWNNQVVIESGPWTLSLSSLAPAQLPLKFVCR